MDAYYEPPVENLKGALKLSAIFHAALFAGMIFLMKATPHENDWGGPGGSISVGIVGSVPAAVPAVPLPQPDTVTESRVVDESKGLYKTEPQPKPEVEDATPIPKFEKNKPPKYVSKPSKLLENKTPPPTNAVPYGGGGTPAVPYSSATTFTMGSGSTQAGMGFTGAGGGNFGQRYSWYVEAVQRRVSGNWLQATVDPGIHAAPRADITFQIMRDGTVANIQILQSSGNASVDTSAVRAIRASSPLQPLPGDYSGGYVSVDFYFDFRRQ
ncbi:MAG: TonB family protein [Candidatus Acidiferrales bacterium]